MVRRLSSMMDMGTCESVADDPGLESPRVLNPEGTVPPTAPARERIPYHSGRAFCASRARNKICTNTTMTGAIPGATASGSSATTERDRSTSTKFNKPAEPAVQYLLQAIEASGYVEIPVSSENGADVSELAEQDLPEEWSEVFNGLQDAGVETISVEDFFDAELEGEYFSVPDLLNTGTGESDGELDDKFTHIYGVDSIEEFIEEYGDAYDDDQLYSNGNEGDVKAKIWHPDFAEEVSQDQFISGLQGSVRERINGHYWPAVQRTLGKGARVKAGKARKHADGRDSWEPVPNGHYEVEADKNRCSHVGFKATDEDNDGVASDVEAVDGDEEVFEQYRDGSIDADDAYEQLADN